MSAELTGSSGPRNPLSCVLPASGWPQEKQARDADGRIKHRPLLSGGQRWNSTHNAAAVCSPTGNGAGGGGGWDTRLASYFVSSFDLSESRARCVLNSAVRVLASPEGPLGCPDRADLLVYVISNIK